jgi:hypothetical protein
MSLWCNEDSDLWETRVPADLQPAVKYLRERFDKAHFNFGWTTRKLCFAQIHETLQESEHKAYIQALVQLEAYVSPSARKRFNEGIALGTLPGIFNAYFDLYLEGLCCQAELVFQELREIGAVHDHRLGASGIDWAESQTKFLVRDHRHDIVTWVRAVCDEQPYDPSEETDELINWRKWQAPRFLIMKPARFEPYDSSRVWKREDPQTSSRWLESFADHYVIRLESAIKTAAGEARLEEAKRPKTKIRALHEAGRSPIGDAIAESPEKPAYIDLLRLPEGLRSSGDPVSGNPFHDNDRRHTIWADATQRAEVELHAFNAANMGHLNEVQTRTEDEARQVMIAYQGHLVTGKFDIWAKRGVHVVWNERDEQSYSEWLQQYANAWLNETRQFYPPELGNIDWLLEELRIRLIARIEYWKSEARRYLIEQAKDRNARVSAPLVPNPPQGSQSEPEAAKTRAREALLKRVQGASIGSTFRLADVATIFDVSEKTIRTWLDEGKLTRGTRRGTVKTESIKSRL